MTNLKPAKPHDRFCGARKKSGEGTCTRPAGWGTDHVGMGKCKLHGGAKRIKSGRYSKIQRDSLRDLIELHKADPDPLDIFPELAAARALFQDFVERYDAYSAALIAWHESYQTERAEPASKEAESSPPEVIPNKPLQILDISDAYRILSEITKIVERIERIRAANAVSRPDLARVMTEMARAVQLNVDDERVQARIKDAWLQIRL